MNNEESKEATLPFDIHRMHELVSRDYAYGQVREALKLYGLGEEKLSLINFVWEQKNNLFTRLGKEEEEKMFHDEGHTNRTVTFIAWALKAAKQNGINIRDFEAEDLILAAIIHDLGYLRQEEDKVLPDFSKTAGGHEERSKQYLRKFLSDKTNREKINRIESYIEATKQGYQTAGRTMADDKGLILRYADLLAGGITIYSDDDSYLQLVRKLANDFYEQNKENYQDVDSAQKAIIENDPRFFSRVVQETEPLIRLLSSLGQEYNLQEVIKHRLQGINGQ